MRLLQTFLFDGRRINKERPKLEKIGVVEFLFCFDAVSVKVKRYACQSNDERDE